MVDSLKPKDDFFERVKTCIAKGLCFVADHSGPIVRSGSPRVNHLPRQMLSMYNLDGRYFVRRCRRHGCGIEFSNLTDIIS